MSLQKFTFLLCTCALFGFSGCESLMHSLHPNQLWKLNRGAPLGRDTYNFSIPEEPLPAMIETPATFEDESQTHH